MTGIAETSGETHNHTPEMIVHRGFFVWPVVYRDDLHVLVFEIQL